MIKLFAILMAFTLAIPASWAESRRFDVWGKAVQKKIASFQKQRLGNSKIDRLPSGVFRPAPEPCYSYAFISKRERSVENIFFANTCTPGERQVTPNTVNTTHFGSLSASPIFHEVASIETDASGNRPISYLTLWRERGATPAYYEFRDRFQPIVPALGPFGQLAFVSTGLDWRDPVIRVTPRIAAYEEPPVVVADDPNDSRTFGRIAWIPARDAAQPGYNKLVVALRWNTTPFGRDYEDRLYLADAATGELAPLKDPADFRGIDAAMAGKEPSVSANGRRLAFIRNVYGRDRLWTCDLTLAPAGGEGGGYSCENARMLDGGFFEPEASQGNFGWPCWSYDGRKIFFSFDGHWTTTTGDRYRKIHMMNPDGTDRIQLNDEQYDDSSPACLPLLLEAAPHQSTATIPEYREPVRLYPANQTYEIYEAPVNCTTDAQCRSDQVCRDNTCRAR